MNGKSARALCTLLALLALSFGASPYTVHAQTASLANIVIAPQNPVLAVGQNITFIAQGYDQNGSPVPIADPQWKAGNGTITPDPANPSQAIFTATEAGSGWVQCSDGPPGAGVHGSTDMTINPPEEGQLAKIEVTPSDVTVRVDEQLQFNAVGLDAFGSPVPIDPEWSVDGGNITADGLYTASENGDFTVTAGTEGSTVTGTSDVHVQSSQSGGGKLARLEISPGDTTVHIGETGEFKAKGYDAEGNQVDITPIWTATGGTIDQNGNFTPNGDGLILGGSVTVSVAGSKVTDSVLVSVLPYEPGPSESPGCPDFAPLPLDTSLGLLTLVLGTVYFVQRRFPRP